MAYDLVVVGAGPGGFAAALEASQCGATVAVVERGSWGGTCSHWGCIPTKALLASSKRYTEATKLKRMGVSAAETAFNFPAMKRHQNQMVRISAAGIQQQLKAAQVAKVEGEGIILSPGEVEVTGSDDKKERIKTRNILIAWGSKPALLPEIEFSDRILSSRTFLAMDTLPGSVVIVGGGAIGVEFATFLAELGAEVTLLELMEQILPTEEKEAAEFLEKELRKLGIEIFTSVSVEAITENDEGVYVKAMNGGEVLEREAEYALICVGRQPYLRTEELERLSIGYDRKGIQVDGRLATTVDTIFAVGDVTGGILLAHRAMAQGRACARALFGDESIPYTDDAVPAVVYTHPGVARVGLTEENARAEGLDVTVRKSEYGYNLTARTEMMGTGFVKTLFSDTTLVGATIVGERAGELIAPVSLAVANRMTVSDLRKWVIPHPTLSELLFIIGDSH